MIYFAICDSQDQFIKIGYTQEDPQKRIFNLRTGNPNQIYCLFYVDGERSLEKRLHKIFKEQNHRKEWFKFEGFLEQFIVTIVDDAWERYCEIEYFNKCEEHIIEKYGQDVWDDFDSEPDDIELDEIQKNLDEKRDRYPNFNDMLEMSAYFDALKEPPDVLDFQFNHLVDEAEKFKEGK